MDSLLGDIGYSDSDDLMKLKCWFHMQRKSVPEKYWKHWAMASNTIDSCKECNMENIVYPDDDLDQMRNQMYEMEKELRKFGLTERTGFECWNWKDFKTAVQDHPDEVELFQQCAEAHVIFYMKYDRFDGEIKDYVPHKTDSCAMSCVKKLNFLNKVGT